VRVRGAGTSLELDNPVWLALQGPQRSLGSVAGGAARFDAEVSPFGGFAGEPSAADWEDMASLVGPGGMVAIISTGSGPSLVAEGWELSWTATGAQMVGPPGGVDRSGPRPGQRPTDPVVALGPDDVPAMLSLVAAARPGPFAVRTVEFGGYIGIRRGGRVVAMAGERLHPPGYAEISAVATDPDHRRQGLAELLIGTVASTIVARGDTPFLHVAGSNTGAIHLYESLGFSRRRTVQFSVFEAPV
jgi:ribosomal protein S18 acetylase RimI-like enzyme